MPTDPNCVFCKIAGGAIPATLLHQDGDTVAFQDLHPQAPTHVLVIPRDHVASTRDLQAGDAAAAGRLIVVAAKLARERGLADAGYRLVINCGKKGGQTVPHLHLHLLAGRQMNWPPG
ncbi:MAG: histidine triad nucleotide-binding protein [Planctomycetes bacterium]|nr:histidine triad nucleotide-binding protein [Planctomycetota bacterium]